MNKDKFRLVLFVSSLLCLFLAVVLSVRLYLQVKGGPPPMPRETNIAYIQPWMTVPHIARIYKVPEDLLFKQLGVNKQQYHNKNLIQIGNAVHKDSKQIIKELQTAIINYQAIHTPPPPPSS